MELRYEDLVTTCPVCNGNAVRHDETEEEDREYACSACEGTGKKLTPTGAAIMRMVWEHMTGKDIVTHERREHRGKRHDE